MKHLIFILFVCIFLLSCKSRQKSISTSELNQETNISNDISLSDYKQLSGLTDQVIKKLVNEQLNIGIKQTKYDTDKPVVEGTEKYPVIEETEISINRKADMKETDSIHLEMNNVCAIKLDDNSDITTKITVKTKEKKETGLNDWQKLLMTVGGLFIIGFFISIIIKIKK